MARPATPIHSEALARLHLAAAQEFGALGLEHASLNRILVSSGMAKSSFYHRYENKRALYDELISRLRNAVEAALKHLDAKPASAQEFWRAASDALAELDRAVAAHPELKAIAALAYRLDAADELGRFRRELTAKLQAWLADGQSLGAVRRDLPPELLAELVVAMLLALDAWALGHAEADEAERVRPGVISALRLIRDTVSGG